MTKIVEWLLNLRDIRLGRDAPLYLRWDDPFPAWLVFGFGLAALTWVVVIYARERGSAVRRVLPAILRCGLIALVVAVLSRPSLVLQRNRVDRSYVAIAIDGSQSMDSTDRYDDAALAKSVAAGADLRTSEQLPEHSRWELARTALTREGGAALRPLLAQNGLQVNVFTNDTETLGFFENADAVDAATDALRVIKPDGASTDIAAAIDSIITRAQGRPLAGIVLISDGQTTQPTNMADALDLARGRQIPIYPVRIGSPQALRDIEVGQPRTRESVFRDDIFAVEVPITVRGLREPTTVTARLIDSSGAVVDSREVSVTADQPSVEVELKASPSGTGSLSYRVEATPLADERLTANNTERVDVLVLDNRLRVLYVEGYPRYEYRYLKNALMREKTVELSVLLIEADNAFVQEGTNPIRRFPSTQAELQRYDVVLFGDVDPQSGWLTSAQMTMLVEFVGTGGGGFGLIAGERSAPHRLLGTPLEKLLPVRIDPAFLGTYDSALTTGFRARLTAEGRHSRLFRFASNRDESERMFQALPECYWFARTLGPKPGASVLLEHPTARAPIGQMPVVVLGRYGAGRLFFQATDDTWRWRRHTGELLHDTYWVQVVRELMRGSRVALNQRYVVRTDRRTYAYGEPVRTTVEVFDPQLLAEQPERIPMSVSIAETHVERSDGSADGEARESSGTDSATAPTGSVVERFTVHRIGPESSTFEGTWIPPRQGRYVVELTDEPIEASAGAAVATVRVERPDLERRHREADHTALERIADATGGQVIELDQLADAFGHIQDRSMQIPDDIVEPLWDSRLVLCLFVAMILMEWVLRKAFGML